MPKTPLKILCQNDLPADCKWQFLGEEKNGKVLCRCTLCNKVERWVVKFNLVNGMTKSCKSCSAFVRQQSRKLNIQPGDEFGSWIVTEDKPRLRFGRWEYPCFCRGCRETTVYVAATSLNRGLSTQCRTCSKAGPRLEKSYFNPSNPKIFSQEELLECSAIGNFNRTSFRHWKFRAKNMGREFSIDMEDIWNLFLQQDGKCNLSGIELILDLHHGNTRSKNNQTASLDRIDSKKGYNLENIQFVHKDINIMKLDYSMDEFLEWCKKVDDYNQLSIELDPINYECKKWYPNYRGYKDICKDYFSNICRSAMGRNLEVTITMKDIWDQFEKQGFRCALTGVPLRFSGNEVTASVDRIDSNSVYSRDNIQIVHKDINFMKQDFTQSEFINWCHLVTQHNNQLAVV